MNTKKRQRRVEAAATLRGVLGHHYRRTGLFGTGAQPLEQTQHHQQHGGEVADLAEGGQGANQGAGNAHQQHRGGKHELAPHAVADHAEQHAAQRADRKAQEVGAKAGDQAHGAGLFREEQRAENQRGGQGVEGKVIVFQRAAQGAGPGGPVQVFLGCFGFGDQVNIR